MKALQFINSFNKNFIIFYISILFFFTSSCGGNLTQSDTNNAIDKIVINGLLESNGKSFNV